MWLIGMMASGKTTVGELAAARLGVPFLDTDAMVVAAAGMSIAEIWADVGEDGFRDLERDAVAAVPGSGVIAAAGGGAVLDPTNREVIAGSSPVVWLRAQPDRLGARLAGNGSRPLLYDPRPARDRLAEILAERESVYAGLATHVIDTDDLEIDDVTDEVVGIWAS